MSDQRTGQSILVGHRKQEKTEALLNGVSQKAKLRLIAKLDRAKRLKGRAFK